MIRRSADIEGKVTLAFPFRLILISTICVFCTLLFRVFNFMSTAVRLSEINKYIWLITYLRRDELCIWSVLLMFVCRLVSDKSVACMCAC